MIRAPIERYRDWKDGIGIGPMVTEFSEDAVRSAGDEEVAEERAFIRAVVAGLADLGAGREVSLAEVKTKLGLG